MLSLLRLFTRLIELLLAVPMRVGNLLLINVAFNPRLGPLRYIVWAVMAYCVMAVMMVYVLAPIRGFVGASYLSEKLTYDAERWLATAIYDVRHDFVGIFDSRLDSQRDVNFTGEAIEVDGYIANPDHKSIPVRAVPELYWQCLLYHEDRYLGTWRNPFGIDLAGVLKIPVSAILASFESGTLRGGAGGSTLPMQLVRVIYKEPPSRDESPWEKLGRKLQEWWLAPVVYHALTRGGDSTPLKKWVANHLWLAQRTGGAPLHGVEVTSRIVFGKEAKELTAAEQFVLASAVNKPIILLPGSERLNAVRLDRWRYLLEVRATRCAETLVSDSSARKDVLIELVEMASGPPDPKVRPRLQAALDNHAPDFAKRAEANPRLRANALFPSTRLGLREELKQAFGLNWRLAVRGVTATLDAADNIAFRTRVRKKLKDLQQRYKAAIKPGFTLDPTEVGNGIEMPDVTVVAADLSGRIVRYYDARETAPYFGSMPARDLRTGAYQRELESRAIASTGKIIAAIAIANEGRDDLGTGYLDVAAPARGLDTCRRNGTLRRARSAQVSFACSFNGPLEWRTARIGQKEVGHLIKSLHFLPPPAGPNGEETPPSTAAVRGLIAGSPQRVHHMAATVLAALAGAGDRELRPPTLIEEIDTTSLARFAEFADSREPVIVPNAVIKPAARGMLKSLLEAPLCYRVNGRSHGTLQGISHWCAQRRNDLRFHFAKTGTQVNEDPDESVDVWATGGLQFSNGAAYSYVVLVGTGTPRQPFARRLHAGQVAAPLLDVLLRDLAEDARRHPVRSRPQASELTTSSTASTQRTAPGEDAGGFSAQRFFERLRVD